MLTAHRIHRSAEAARREESVAEYAKIAALLQQGRKSEARVLAEHIPDETVRTLARVLIERSHPIGQTPHLNGWPDSGPG